METGREEVGVVVQTSESAVRLGSSELMGDITSFQKKHRDLGESHGGEIISCFVGVK